MKRCFWVLLVLIYQSMFAGQTFKQEIFTESAALFSGGSNPQLAASVAEILQVDLGKATIGTFNDGETSIHIDQNVRNKDVFIIQSTCRSNGNSVNDNVMELYLLVRTMKRASARSVTVLLPYYGYARQDRKNISRVPISASDIALLLETAGVDRVVAVDLHCGQIQGFFHRAPVDNLYAATVLVPYFAQKDLSHVVVVAPDAGGVDRAKKFAQYLNRAGHESGMALISKERSSPGVIQSVSLIGDVEGADAIIVDDLCDTAGTLTEAAKLLKDCGARRVFAAITHPVFSGSAYERIEGSVLEELVITDTIPLEKPRPLNVQQVSIASLLADAIRKIFLGESISDIFQ